MSADAIEVRVRDAGPDDAVEVARIWRDGWRDGHLGNVPDALAAARTAESFSTRAAERVADTRVAVVDDAIAGFTMVVADELEQLYVDGSQRGRGVSDILIADAENRIREAGHDSAWLAVVSGNARARRFYERAGWVDAGTFDYQATTAHGVIPVPCQRYVRALRG